MARYFLSGLEVEGFRGINNEGDPLKLKFAPDKVNSVFAVNGNGKSSIFESLCYAVKGSIEKLDALQSSEKPDNYYCNQFHSQGQATIVLSLQPDDGSAEVVIKIERLPSGKRSVSSPSGHHDPERLLADLNEDFTLLDHKTFLRFIDEKPLNRGRSFSSLLGLSAYSDMRQSLQTVCDSKALNNDFELKVLAANIKSAEDQAGEALTLLRDNYQHVTGNSLDDVGKLEVAGRDIVKALETVQLLKAELSGKTLSEVDFDKLKVIIREQEGGENRREFEKLVEDFAKLEALGQPDDAKIQDDLDVLTNFLQDRDHLLSHTRGASFKTLYEAAEALVKNGEWDADDRCPLCDGHLTDSFREHVDLELKQYASLVAKNEEIKTRWRGSALLRRLYKIEAHDLFRVEDNKQISRRVTADADAGKLTLDTLQEVVTGLNALEKAVTDKTESIKAAKDKLEKELPPSLVQLTEQVERARQFQQVLAIWQSSEKERAKNKKILDIRERWRSFIQGAQKSFSDAEGKLSSAKITKIEPQYKSMFQEIMKVSDIVPELKRNQDTEDLYVQLSDFHGKNAPSARALLSESFVNALAIAVYLAAALSHKGAPRFLVLDDVTSSFDAGHQLALMELIRTKLQQPGNTNGLQFLILSHDGLLEKYFDRLGNDGNWKHHRLQGSPPMGAILSQAQDSDRLRVSIMTLLNAGQIAQAEPLIRQYLEAVLMKVIRKVSIPVPIDFAMRESNRMVGNCIDAITSAIKLHKSASTLILSATQEQNLSAVHVPALLGNWCSHYETATTASLSAPMLKSVVQSIDDLADCFQWTDTSTPPVKRWYKSLSSR